MKKKQSILIIALAAASVWWACTGDKADRQVISLNGEWQIAKTDSLPPQSYASVAPVPGLVDLAVPALEPDTARYEAGWYWYRRTFSVADTAADIIRLKLRKARYHTKVYVNGHYVGENYFSFSPVSFDVKPYVRAGADNELVIGVGCRSQLPDTIQNGHDFETVRYRPGIYDDVQLTLARRPFINNIQCAPDIDRSVVRVVAELDAGDCQVAYVITEKKSGRKVASGKTSAGGRTDGGMRLVDFEAVIPRAELWSPEHPFLYEVSLSTAADRQRATFGMRSFRFDRERGLAVLNGKPFYMLGTNVAMGRFFEDADRGTLPWNKEWAAKVIAQYKTMNWRILRYHIGPAPELWYELCDSLGMMVQDEFAISGKQLQPLRAPLLAEEFRRGMRDRWNHPSIVIWDANNESTTLETGKAIREVRRLDLSRRPWENGWAQPDTLTDPLESHPYMFLTYFVGGKPSEQGYLKDLFGYVDLDLNDANGNSPQYIPAGERLFPNIRFINEYGWLWLNRDGSTTRLTEPVYKTLFGDGLTPERRRYLYARHLAMLTEYWRAHRQTAGVMHFCGLGYSRPDEPKGETSDNFADVKAAEFEAEFYRYVKPAFAPVGLMIDLWEKSYRPSSAVKVPVFVSNDLETEFVQDVNLVLMKDGKALWSSAAKARVESLKTETLQFEMPLPADAGSYQLKASIVLHGEEVFSLRDIPVE
jgi:hypothetical protein